jgi:hypothetical protein
MSRSPAPEHFLHRRRMAEDVRRFGAFDAVALLALTLCQCAADQFDGMVHIEGLVSLWRGRFLKKRPKAVITDILGNIPPCPTAKNRGYTES